MTGINSRIFCRLRPDRARRQPAFRPGERYRLIEQTYPEGYVFLELNGRPRCVCLPDFEAVEETS